MVAGSDQPLTVPIDANVEDNRKLVGAYEVWDPVDEPETLGIHGAHVAVDFDLRIAAGTCLENCPVYGAGTVGRRTDLRRGGPSSVRWLTTVRPLVWTMGVGIVSISANRRNDGGPPVALVVGQRHRISHGQSV